MPPDEQRCEDHFITTHSRASNGRYIVRLPFKNTETPIAIDTSYRLHNAFHLKGPKI